METWKQWRHWYLTFWFAGNGLEPATYKYCDFNATLTYSVKDEKCNIAISEIKGIQYNLYKCAVLYKFP